MACAALTSIVALALALAATPAGASTAADLDARLAASPADARIEVIATLSRQVDGARYEGRPGALIRALQRTADRTQDAVTDDVDGPVQRFWLVNAVAFAGTPEEIRAVAADPGVDRVELDRQVRLADRRVRLLSEPPFPDPGDGNWGLAAIRVPDAWEAYEVRGAGVRVGLIDTGVDPANPDLAGKVVAWRDFVTGGAAPFDDNGHGTHTAGTIVGGSARGAAIGVAPEADLVVARAMGASGVGPGSALLAAAEWMTDPDGDPTTADQPAVINNSWSAPNANDVWFRPMIQRWLELGIVPVFAAGNSGPDASTVGSPAGYPEALAVGAIDSDSALPEFSARGPVLWSDTDGLGPAAGTLLTKPDLAAPGVGVVSSVGSGYLASSGTSMAAPHVAGVVALVRGAAPGIDAQGVVDLLRSTAVDLGKPGLDQGYGAGRVDAVRALEAAVGPVPDTRFVTTPPRATRAAIASFSMTLSGGGVAVRTRVDEGQWSQPSSALTLALPLGEGRHVVEAQAVSAAGALDRTPARHVFTVDRTRPRVAITMSRRGTRALFSGRVSDPQSGARRGSIRWSFGEGETARGVRVGRTFAESRTRTVVLTARDAAGNQGFAVRRFRPRAAAPVRGLRVSSRASRSAGTLAVTGRLVRSAALHAALRPVRAAAAPAQHGPAASFVPHRVGPAVARGAVGASAAGRFRLKVPIAGVRAGTYRLEIRSSGSGGGDGLRITRRVEIR